MSWSLDSAWFDVAVMSGIFAVGNILFGHFEAHKSKLRRVFKMVVITTAVAVVAQRFGRVWAYSPVGLLLLGAAYVHIVWLPKHGINGWTGEPRDKYLELVGAKSKTAAAK